MNLHGKSVLITGAGGFIGSHLAEELVRYGASVTAFVKYNSRSDGGMLEVLSQDIYDSIDIKAGDLRDPEAICDAVKDVDVIFHLGSIISIPYSYINPRDVIETNIIGTLNVMQAARKYSTDKIVHTSTSEVYGTAQYVPIDEVHPLQGQSPYSASKIGADKIAESFFLSFCLPVAIIRPFNTYGPRQSARAIIPTIISQALTQDKISLGSLSPKRDLTFVKDMTNGFIKMAESSDSVGEVINIGSGSDISIGDLASLILDMMRINKEIVIDKKRIRPEGSEVMRLCCDNKKARKVLGWTPEVPLQEGLRSTIEWVKNSINAYKADIYVR